MSGDGKKDFRELRGMLERPGQRPLSVEEMDDAILRFHAEEMRRIDEQAECGDDDVRTESDSE